MAQEDRWPPVYDADDLVREIKNLTARPDLAAAFYEWRRDTSMLEVSDVCQGDLIELRADVPLILEDGEPGAMEHPTATWLVIGNTCDFVRNLDEARWTQLVPVHDLGRRAELAANVVATLPRYTQSRAFYIPPWSAAAESQVCIADFLRPVAVDKRAFSEARRAVVVARMSRPAWILLNACLVRFLARDDGRYDDD